MKDSKKSQKDKDIEYINSQIKQLQDGYLIESLIKMRKEIEKEKSPQKKFRESMAVKPNRTTTPMKKQEKPKRKIKQKPKVITKKVVLTGMIAGLSLGILGAKLAYNYTSNMPVAHNYITTKEKRNGVTDRSEHDNSNYKKYLMKQYGLTESEAEEKIKDEEEELEID